MVMIGHPMLVPFGAVAMIELAIVGYTMFVTLEPQRR